MIFRPLDPQVPRQRGRLRVVGGEGSTPDRRNRVRVLLSRARDDDGRGMATPAQRVRRWDVDEDGRLTGFDVTV